MLKSKWIQLAIFCANEERKAREHGKSPGPQDWNDELIEELCRELAEMSSTRQPSGDNSPQSDHDEASISSSEVAAMTGWDIRKVQRNADKLGGQKVAGRLVFREHVIREHIEGSAA